MFNKVDANFKVKVESLQEITTFLMRKLVKRIILLPIQLDQNVILAKLNWTYPFWLVSF